MILEHGVGQAERDLDPARGMARLRQVALPNLDGRIVVSSRNSFASAKELMDKEGIFAGVSGGAVLKTAQRAAQRFDKANIVMLLADGGWKYLSSNLWNADYSNLPDDLEAKTWW